MQYRKYSMILVASVFSALPALAQAEDRMTVTATRLGNGIAGATAKTVSAKELADLPQATLPEKLSFYSGFQSRDLFGGANGNNATLDLRGFGASAKQNLLVLQDGRRLNDLDLAAVDWGSLGLLPLARVEILPGSAGAVLYGDGAVGGVINLVTESRPQNQIRVTGGSDDWKSLAESGGTTFENWNLGAQASHSEGNGFRQNSDSRQSAGTISANHAGTAFDTRFSLSADRQAQGLPGARNVNLNTGVNELQDDPRGATTPFDRANQEGVNLSGSLAGEILGGDASLDGSVRHKRQEARIISAFGPVFDSFVGSDLDSVAITPRLDVAVTDGLRLRTGLDAIWVDYQSDRSQSSTAAPIHRYDLSQDTGAAYGLLDWQAMHKTSLSAGWRGQFTRTTATDRFDITAPGASIFDAQQAPLDDTDFNWMGHLGVEQGLGDATLFARLGRSVRLPTVDERVASFGGRVDFNLKTQQGWDAEIGARGEWGGWAVESSLWRMDLRNELAFDATTFTNRNLDDTRRIGVNASAEKELGETVSLRLNASVIDAEYSKGVNRGNEVSLVAPVTASAVLGWQPVDMLSLTSSLRWVDSQRMDNDAANFQPEIPAYTLLDLGAKLAMTERVSMSLAVNNALDEDYFTYAVASAFTAGVYNAYPLPGRSVFFTVSATW